MTRTFRNLVADTRGSGTVELALIAPMLAVMVVGVVDLSNGFSRKLALEQGAHRAIEKVMQTTELDTVEGTLKNEAVCQVNGANADGTCKSTPIALSNVTVTWRLECRTSTGALTSQTSTDATAFDAFTCPGGTAKEARYISVSLTDKYTPMFPLTFAGYNAGTGGYPIYATAGMRTQ